MESIPFAAEFPFKLQNRAAVGPDCRRRDSRETPENCEEPEFIFWNCYTDEMTSANSLSIALESSLKLWQVFNVDYIISCCFSAAVITLVHIFYLLLIFTFSLCHFLLLLVTTRRTIEYNKTPLIHLFMKIAQRSQLQTIVLELLWVQPWIIAGLLTPSKKASVSI